MTELPYLIEIMDMFPFNESLINNLGLNETKLKDLHLNDFLKKSKDGVYTISKYGEFEIYKYHNLLDLNNFVRKIKMDILYSNKNVYDVSDEDEKVLAKIVFEYFMSCNFNGSKEEILSIDNFKAFTERRDKALLSGESLKIAEANSIQKLNDSYKGVFGKESNISVISEENKRLLEAIRSRNNPVNEIAPATVYKPR